MVPLPLPPTVIFLQVSVSADTSPEGLPHSREITMVCPPFSKENEPKSDVR